MAESSREAHGENSLEYTREAAKDGDVRSVLVLARAMTGDGEEWGLDIDIVEGVRLFLSIEQGKEFAGSLVYDEFATRPGSNRYVGLTDVEFGIVRGWLLERFQT